MRLLKRFCGLLLGLAMPLAMSSAIRADAVSDWNAIAVQTIVNAGPTHGSAVSLLDNATVQVAVYDAVEAIDGRFKPYHVHIPGAFGSPAAEQVAKAGAFPQSFPERALFLLRLVLNPWVIGGLFAAFLAFLCWMAALTKFELSYAYPFMSLAFVFVLILSGIFFHETVSMPKMFGIVLIVTGIIIASRG